MNFLYVIVLQIKKIHRNTKFWFLHWNANNQHVNFLTLGSQGHGGGMVLVWWWCGGGVRCPCDGGPNCGSGPHCCGHCFGGYQCGGPGGAGCCGSGCHGDGHGCGGLRGGGGLVSSCCGGGCRAATLDQQQCN